ncbi:MAG: hypothetical protein K9I94_09675 [Bacteroidales bacterium]|nr:hypothetical protein [Bacteroidales bacterium]
MKKINVLLAILFLSGAVFFTSCSEDDDDNVDVSPNISFKGGEGFTANDTEVPVGDSVKVGITAQQNDNSGKKLNHLEVTMIFNNVENQVYQEDLNDEFIDRNFTITVNNEGPSRYVFKVTDKANETAEVDITLTGVPSTGPIYSYSEKIMGSYDNNNDGSSFASADGTVYDINEAKNNSEKVDWMYSYGNSTNATIMAPSDDLADAFFGDNMDDFNTRNETMFKLIEENVDWDNIEDDGPIMEYTSSGVDQTSLTQLEEGEIIGFITDPNKSDFAGKHGLIRVDAIQAGADGSIEISVKVQQ